MRIAMSTRPISRRGPGGFTLLEVMIALAIMGIGMTTAAALFVAAIKENENSFNNSIGTIVCENAIATAQTMLTPGNVTWTNDLEVIADELKIDVIPLADQHYPRGNPRTGFVLLGRQIAAGPTDPDPLTYQLVAVSYRKEKSVNQVSAIRIIPTSPLVPLVAAGEKVLRNVKDPDDNIRLGSPVIVRISTPGNNDIQGSYARIVSVNDDGTAWELDHVISTDEDVTSAYVIVEGNNVNPELGISDLSPAMLTMAARTGLRN